MNPDLDIGHRFLESASKAPENPALHLDGKLYSYAELAAASLQLAGIIKELQADSSKVPIGIFADIDLMTYFGVVSSALSGIPYVPFSSRHPDERIAQMLQLTGAQTVIVGSSSVSPARNFLSQYESPLNVVAEPGVCSSLDLSNTRHAIHSIDPFREKSPPPRSSSSPESLLYILFTSGTTGIPKGVPVKHANLSAYLKNVSSVLPLSSEDRCTQVFDFTFDVSVHDMFFTWTNGACLFPIPSRYRLAAPRFINKHKITSWYSTPYVASSMLQTGQLRDGLLDSLRYSSFAGEALSQELASAWKRAAPGSRIFNFYGPTEGTIVVSGHEWLEGGKNIGEWQGFVPIGRVFPSLKYRLSPRPAASTNADYLEGELALSGAQIVNGYLNADCNDKSDSQTRFSRDQYDKNRIWYNTSDLVREFEDGTLLYLGRIDRMAKIRGYRVELLEVEQAVRSILGDYIVRALAWPPSQSNPDKVVCAVQGKCDIEMNEGELKHALGKILPRHMVPVRIVFLTSIPTTISGKIDDISLGELIRTAI